MVNVTALGNTPATIMADTFGDRSAVCLTIPVGTETAYINAEWTGFSSVKQDDPVLSVEDFDLNETVKLNINTNTLNVILPTTIKLENYTVYSISGAKVLNGTENNISIASLSKGVYIVKLVFDKGIVRKKFVVD